MAAKKNGNKVTNNVRIKPSEDEIRIRAYEIYLARKGRPGSEIEDWLQAERELSMPATVPPGD